MNHLAQKLLQLANKAKAIIPEPAKELINEGKALVNNLLPPQDSRKMFPLCTFELSSRGNRTEGLPTVSATVSIPFPDDADYLRLVKERLVLAFTEIWDGREVSITSDRDEKKADGSL